MEEFTWSLSTPTNSHGGVTATASDDLRKDLNLNEDIVKRKDGAEKFGKFTEIFERILLWESFDDDEWYRENSRKAIYHAGIPRNSIMNIQALFLGEKPVVWDVFTDESKVTKDQREKTYQLFKNFGFEIVPDAKWEVFVYNPKLVEEVIKKYPEVFGDVEVKKVINPKFKEMDDIRLWLLLGYPMDACKWFKKYEEYRVAHSPEADKMTKAADEYHNSQDDKNWYGMTFRDFEVWEETKALRERMKKAFQESGILKIWDTTKR